MALVSAYARQRFSDSSAIGRVNDGAGAWCGMKLAVS